MAWTGRDVTLRLRSELGDERLVVKYDPAVNGGRWVVCVRRRMLSGARRWPVKILDDGAVVRGSEPTTIREVCPFDDIVYVHETPEGEYLSLEPNLLRQALVERDTHRRNLARELMDEVRRRKAEKTKRFRDEVAARTSYYRGAFAKVAEDMGLGGKADLTKLGPRELPRGIR